MKTALHFCFILYCIHTVISVHDRPNIIVFLLDDFDCTNSMSESTPTDFGSDYLDINTTWINKIRNEGFIFPYTYSAGTKSNPGRYSILTGRYPSRSTFAQWRTVRDGSNVDGYNGTYVDSGTIKIENGSIDSYFNLPNILATYTNYSTGLVGLYGLFQDYESYCGNITQPITNVDNMATLYSKCQTQVEQFGWNYVDGLYIDEIDDSNGVFSHNPEWMVQKAINFINNTINEDKPFFLYYASTLAATPQAYEAMFNYSLDATPRGYLNESETPNNSGMKSRKDIYDAVVDAGWKNARLEKVLSV